MSDDGKSVKVTDSLLELYGTLDKHLENVLETKFKSSCVKGCTHCCYLLATITFAEALLIAEKILGLPDWKDWVPKIRAAAVLTNYHGITRVNYFNKGNPCVFLGEDRLCQIYEFRPACCRYHIVGSPPENCSRFAPPSTKTMTLDLMQMEEEVWKLSMAVVTQLNEQQMMVGPLALMVLACMRFITMNATEDQDIADHTLINRACEGLRSPIQWMMECGRTLAEEEDNKPPVRVELKDYKGLLK
jgi:Fe-S-cluster containining protein